MSNINLIILGSIAIDSVETPFGKKQDILGGSAAYASVAARQFIVPGLVSIVGDDFPSKYYDFFNKNKIDLSGLMVSGKTFRWTGFYEYDMNSAKTLKTELNCLEIFDPIIPESYKKASYVFLGNMHPQQQLKVLEQIESPDFVAMDTMNLWIIHAKEDLIKMIKKVDMLLLNDTEIRLLFDEVNFIKAAKKALKLGPEIVVIKKGEHGVLVCSKDYLFSVPGYPLENVVDPTGCGDTFAGALMGYLASKGVNQDSIKRAVVYGSLCATVSAEGFGLSELKKINLDTIERRYKKFKELITF